MFNKRSEAKASCGYTFPRTKLRNVFCIRCKHQFFLREFVPLCGLVPLLLECGHVICETCVKLYPTKACPLCNVISQSKDYSKMSLPLNMYALGLIVVSHNRPVHTDDSHISFHQPVNSKLRQPSTQGLCHECGVQASVKCPQCVALFCFSCYSKIHGRALQSHSKIILAEGSSESFSIMRTTCSETCNESVGYYCKECNISGCSHCMLRFHPKHDYIALADKNEELVPEFYKVSERVSESLQRVRLAQKKLKTIRIFPAELQSSESVEASITQHFAHLHGVLQNLEKKLINKLYQQRDYLNDNLEEIALQLKKQEDQLQSALVMTSTIGECMDKVDIEELIQKLQELADIPCHLVQDPVPDDQKITFDFDKTIIAALEEHCTVQIPSISGFSLQRTELLPDDYEIEPLTQEISIPKVLDKPSSLVTPLSHKKVNNTVLTEGSSEMVRVTHIVDPACFYVQQISYQNKLAELTKGLTSAANNTGVLPTEVALNKLYIVQSAEDKQWYRGRVTKKKASSSKEERYDIFFVDVGIKDDDVSLVRMRNIPPQFATLPVMATKCALYDVVPNNGKWCNEATEAFKRLVTGDAMVSMHVVTICGDIYYVDLCAISPKDSGLASVADLLTYMKYASRVTSNKLMRINPNAGRKYFKEQLEIDKYTDVHVQFVESPYCIYVQKIHENKSYFHKVIQDMTNEYEQSMISTGFIHVPDKNLPCAARGVDGQWHRGRICEVPTENTVKVFYVDLGYSLVLRYDDIRTLLNKYMSCRTQAIKLSLKNIRPLPSDNGQWSAEAIDFTKDLLLNTDHVRIMPYDKFQNTYNVSMYINGTVNVAAMLLKRGLAVSVKSSVDEHALAQNSSLNNIHPTNTCKKKRYKAKKNTVNANEVNACDTMNTSVTELNVSKEVEDPFKICVLIHHVQSPDCIFVADASCQKSNTEMMKNMQEFYSKYHSEKRETWSKDAVCAVYSVKDKAYFRAKIMEIKSANEVVVFLYDMGITETVSTKDIQSLYPDYSQIPAYLFQIKLAGILPCGGYTTWPSLSCEELREIINENQNCKFYVSKLEEDTESSIIPVELWVKQTKLDGPLAPTRIEINSVNRMLVEKGVALPIKDYAKKRDKILAIELKRQLQKRLEMFSQHEMNVKWFKVNDPNKYLSLETSINESQSELLLQSSESSYEDDDYNSEDTCLDFKVPPKLSAWIAPGPIVKDRFIAIPTYLDYDGFLYLHSKKQSNKILQYIETKLEEFYKNSMIETCDVMWAPGDMCIAKYHGNNKWYRGKVLKILENSSVEVVFVDYGNVEECEIGTLKKKVILGHIPIQCTKCKVYGLNSANPSGKWTTIELDKIHALLIEKECEVNVLQRTDAHLLVSITLLPGPICDRKTDLISFLSNECGMKFHSLNESVTPEKSVSSIETPDVVIEELSVSETDEVIEDAVISGHSVLFRQVDTKCKDSVDLDDISWHELKDLAVSSTPYVVSEENLAMNYKAMRIPHDIQYIEIELCCSISATKFYAQLKENTHSTVLNTHYTQYELLMNELQENACKEPMLKSLTPNTPCCAKFTDGLWYRCLILDTEQHAGTDSVEVRLLYVDFGNDEYRTVNSKACELYTLKAEWADLPVMAIKCQLSNIEVAPTEDYNAFISQLRELYNRTVIATIENSEGEFISVKLYENAKCEEVMYISLIKEGSFLVKSEKTESICDF